VLIGPRQSPALRASALTAARLRL